MAIECEFRSIHWKHPFADKVDLRVCGTIITETPHRLEAHLEIGNPRNLLWLKQAWVSKYVPEGTPCLLSMRIVELLHCCIVKMQVAESSGTFGRQSTGDEAATECNEITAEIMTRDEDPSEGPNGRQISDSGDFCSESGLSITSSGTVSPARSSLDGDDAHDHKATNRVTWAQVAAEGYATNTPYEGSRAKQIADTSSSPDTHCALNLNDAALRAQTPAAQDESSHGLKGDARGMSWAEVAAFR